MRRWCVTCTLLAVVGCGSETRSLDGTVAEAGTDHGPPLPDGRPDGPHPDATSDRTGPAADCGASCRTDTSVGPDPILVGASDIAVCGSSGAEQTAKLLDAAFASKPPGAIFTAGDNSNESGTATQFTTCFNPTWGRHKPLIHPSPGNHDYMTSGASGYFNYFGAAAGDPKKGYYSYTVGTWHVVVLNGNCSQVGGCQKGSPQETWLRADLAANPTTCTLAHWHQPRFSSGGLHGSDATYQPLWQALYDLGADVVVNGHDHHYERFAPQTPTGTADATKGIREFIVGTGGAGTRALGTIRANSEVRNTGTLGVLKLTLHATSYDWEFVPVAGKTFKDSGTTACH
jgi:acid phosphatase type 7